MTAHDFLLDQTRWGTLHIAGTTAARDIALPSSSASDGAPSGEYTLRPHPSLSRVGLLRSYRKAIRSNCKRMMHAEPLYCQASNPAASHAVSERIRDQDLGRQFAPAWLLMPRLWKR